MSKALPKALLALHQECIYGNLFRGECWRNWKEPVLKNASLLTDYASNDDDKSPWLHAGVTPAGTILSLLGFPDPCVL